jgi:hypothetical protein
MADNQTGASRTLGKGTRSVNEKKKKMDGPADTKGAPDHSSQGHVIMIMPTNSLLRVDSTAGNHFFTQLGSFSKKASHASPISP